MALFGRKKKEKSKGERVSTRPETKQQDTRNDGGDSTVSDDKKSLPDVAQVSGEALYTVLKGPRITEKATDLSEYNTFVFEVRQDANKQEIKKAVEALYNVHPIDIRIVQIPRKKVITRGKEGLIARGKKAYVKLPEGERIELI